MGNGSLTGWGRGTGRPDQRAVAVVHESVLARGRARLAAVARSIRHGHLLKSLGCAAVGAVSSPASERRGSFCPLGGREEPTRLYFLASPGTIQLPGWPAVPRSADEPVECDRLRQPAQHLATIPRGREQLNLFIRLPRGWEYPGQPGAGARRSSTTCTTGTIPTGAGKRAATRSSAARRRGIPAGAGNRASTA